MFTPVVKPRGKSSSACPTWLRCPNLHKYVVHHYSTRKHACQVTLFAYANIVWSFVTFVLFCQFCVSVAIPCTLRTPSSSGASAERRIASSALATHASHHIVSSEICLIWHKQTSPLCGVTKKAKLLLTWSSPQDFSLARRCFHPSDHRAAIAKHPASLTNKSPNSRGPFGCPFDQYICHLW